MIDFDFLRHRHVTNVLKQIYPTWGWGILAAESLDPVFSKRDRKHKINIDQIRVGNMSAAPVGSAIVRTTIGNVQRTTPVSGRCLPRVCLIAPFSNSPNQAQALVAPRSSTSDAAADTTPEPTASAATHEASAGEEPSVSAGDSSSIPPALLRKSAAASDAVEALDILAEGLPGGSLTDADCRFIMAAALERGNGELAQSIFRSMTAAAAGTSASISSLMSVDSNSSNRENGLSWPPSTIETAAALVIGLCRALRIKEAVGVISSVRSRGLPSTEDIQFGYVVECPLNATGKPLAIMQPQEGVRTVVDSFSRYEYELFSGTAVSVSSESLVAESSGAVPDLIGSLIKGNSFLQRWGVLWRPSAVAVHTIVVQTPAGMQRTFRFGTRTADVPARQADRITVVCAPQTPRNTQIFGLTSSPPETKPGEPLSLTNHTLEITTQLARPPKPGMPGGLPNWVIPATAALVAADAASSLVNPIFPYLMAGAVASTAVTAVAAQKVALPRLKQLPLSKLEIQATRQKLLGQHNVLEKRVVELVRESEEDVRVLARLWQLQAKMGAVSGGGGTYDARMERISETRTAIESRLRKRIEMVDAYAKVISMIEIEVEMETQLPVGEVEGIEIQIAKLEEIEELQAEYQIQAEAQDEVERLLRTAP